MRGRCFSVPALVLAGTVVVAACSDAEGATKSGGPDPPVELTIVNNDGGGDTVVTPAMGRFVDRVRQLSEGRLVVRVVAGEWATDGREVAAVAAGRADLGWVGTRAFDLLGVDEFRPLHAPLLIDGYGLQAAVVQSDAARAMLAGLEPLGVTPLALFADELRFPASVARPLLTPQDWDGTRIWLLESGAYAEAVEAFGGIPLHTFASGGDLRQMIQEGDVDGLETMWVYYALGADYLYSPFVVPNVSLGPRTTALFANPAALARLDESQQRWLRQAAADTVAWSGAHAADGIDSFVQDVCRHGARVAMASPDELAVLADAVAPMHERLRTAPATAGIFATIEALAATVPDDPPLAVPVGCRYSRGEEAHRPARQQPLPGPGSSGAFPEGTYRYDVDSDDIVHGQDTLAKPSMAGVFTWTMSRGEWTVTTRPSAAGVAPITCRGWYTVDDDTVRFTHLPDPAIGHCLPMVWSARWTTDDDRSVTWHPPVPAILAPHQADVEWRRIE